MGLMYLTMPKKIWITVTMFISPKKDNFDAVAIRRLEDKVNSHVSLSLCAIYMSLIYLI